MKPKGKQRLGTQLPSLNSSLDLPYSELLGMAAQPVPTVCLAQTVLAPEEGGLGFKLRLKRVFDRPSVGDGGAGYLSGFSEKNKDPNSVGVP